MKPLNRILASTEMALNRERQRLLKERAQILRRLRELDEQEVAEQAASYIQAATPRLQPTIYGMFRAR